jgi:hypothetical protein
MTMTTYMILLCAHVVVAILGLGQIAGMLVLALVADESAGPTTWRTLARLVRGASFSLGLMFATGALMEYVGGGVFHDTWWFRISFVLLLALGAINGLIGRALRTRDRSPSTPILPLVRRGAWAMCALVGAVTILMETKPW